MIFFLLISHINSNFFTYGIRKILGLTIGKSGCQDSTLTEKSSEQSSNSSSNDKKSKNKITKEEFLEAKIRGMTIGLIPLGINFSYESNWRGYIKNGFMTRQFFPCYLGGCTFNHHALGLLYTDKGEILIEYGAYIGQPEEYKNETYYYPYSEGARFTPIEFDDFFEFLTKNGNYSYFDKSIWTNINNHMTVGELFRTINRKMNLTFEGYNVADNNCQDFIANAINILGAKRTTHNCNSKRHNLSKLYIPPKILEALESNEDYQILTSLGKIPVLGVFTDYIGCAILD